MYTSTHADDDLILVSESKCVFFRLTLSLYLLSLTLLCSSQFSPLPPLDINTLTCSSMQIQTHTCVHNCRCLKFSIPMPFQSQNLYNVNCCVHVCTRNILFTVLTFLEYQNYNTYVETKYYTIFKRMLLQI